MPIEVKIRNDKIEIATKQEKKIYNETLVCSQCGSSVSRIDILRDHILVKCNNSSCKALTRFNHSG